MESRQYYYMVDELADRIGGQAKMTVLLQRRARELIKGYPRLVEIDSDDPVKIVFEELIQGKISLELQDEILITGDKEK